MSCSVNPKPVVKCDIRSQFTLTFCSVRDVCELMSEISNLKINVFAFTIIDEGYNTILFKFVPSNKSSQSIPDINAIRCLLDRLGLNYFEDQVLRVHWSSGFTGIFGAIVCELSKDVDIYYSYLAEDSSIIFQVNNLNKAINAFN